MPIQFLTAIIAGLVSLVLGIFTFFTTFLCTWLKIQADLKKQVHSIEANSQNLLLDIEDRYRKSIFDKRIGSYPNAWNIIGRLSSMNLNSSSSDPVKEIKSVMLKLHNWYNDEGGILLSTKSRDRYFELRTLSMELKETPDIEDIKRIWRSKMNFRNSLRKDILLEEELSEHSEEEWDFPERVKRDWNLAKYKEREIGND